MFEIGDRVIYQGADKAAYKREGTVVSIEDKDGKPQLTVELDGGETFTAPIDDWSRKFANACRNAKFKVGDKVIVDEKEAVYGGLHGKVTDVDGSGYVGVKITDKNKYNADFLRAKESILRLANACTSTNSVVANAMAANARVARNADRIEEKSFGNGDVKASMKDFGRDPIYEIAVYTTGITSAVSFADKGKKCVAEARAVLSAIERKASALKQAIAWMEQNAKAW